MTRAKARRRTRTRRLLGVPVVAAVLAVSLLPVVGSTASWRDGEWDRARAGTLDCADRGTFATRGSGRFIGGSMLTAEPGAPANVDGITVTNDGTTPRPDPAESEQVAEAAWANPLSVQALGTLTVATSGDLDDLLELDTDNDVGLLNQFARARDDGHAQGASGAVNDSGVVMTDRNADGTIPTVGVLRLSTLVEALTDRAIADVVSGVSDLSLEIGAVAARSSLDACNLEWTGELATNLDRSYLVAALRARMESPAVAAAGATLSDSLAEVEALAAGLADDPEVIGAIDSGVRTLLDGVLGTLTVGSVDVTGPTLTLDPTPVERLATATISDDAGLVELDLATGSVAVDLASLLGTEYGGQGGPGATGAGLNQLPPNTRLVADSDVADALTAALTQALDRWSADAVAAMRSMVDQAQVHTEITIELEDPLLTLPVARLQVTVDGTLEELRQNTAVVDVTYVLLGAVSSDLLADIVAALEDGTAPVVAAAIDAVLLAADSPVTTVGTTLGAATSTATTALRQALVDYLGPDGLVVLVANVQNDPLALPDGSSPGSYPEWETGTRAVPDSQYDVAALSVGVVSSPATTTLELGRASVGRNCLLRGPAASTECDQY